MSKEHVYRFKLAGVTMNNRQKTLACLRRALLSRCKSRSDAEYQKRLGEVKTRLVREPDNEHDRYATKIAVWSAKKKKWLVIGYIPAKDVKKGIALSRVIAILIDNGRVTDHFLSTLDVFMPEDGKDEVYYAQMTIKFRIQDEN